MKLKQLFVASSLVVLCAGCSMFGSGSRAGSDQDQGDLSEQDLNAQRDNRFGAGGIPEAEGEGLLRDIHFDYDSSAINDQARQDIEYNVQVIQANPEVKIQLEGHCDERGTAEYNMALGSARAKAVKDVFTSYGVENSKLGTISYGEEVPLEPGHEEPAWAANRRVHFSPYTDAISRR